MTEVHPRVIQVTRDGAGLGWLELQSSLEQAHFVAVDTEFTGILKQGGNSPADLEERYATLRECVSSRAVVEVGISIFTEKGLSDVDTSRGKVEYVVRNFQLLFCPQDDFSVSPSSGAFLTRHGFDFNQMFTEGIPYTAPRPTHAGWTKRDNASAGKNGEHRKEKRRKKSMVGEATAQQWQPLPQGLLRRITAKSTPLIVHNGLYDLMFLYKSFEAPLPDSFARFVQALSSISPSIFDTKTLASTLLEEETTFLAYLFAKCVRRNADNRNVWLKADSGVKVNCLDGMAAFPPLRFAPPRTLTQASPEGTNELCKTFRTRGFCQNPDSCRHSHDIELVLDLEQSALSGNDAPVSQVTGKTNGNNGAVHPTPAPADKVSKKKRRHQQRQRLCELSAPAQSDRSDHSAGFDAYCTGYIFATYTQAIGRENLQPHMNRLFLSGRKEPVLLEPSRFDDGLKAVAPAPAK
mmetsp:Transcript_11686/g.35624  ORF Transcript_11686/g.35624 Transcript_11686/m.35624 type:complete len:464 (+) Transcript_11686:135-1526(+)|eukprot:CAMPEP_0198727070 /NCGR_PEP_ID=MMETSP1475-20131203/3910_1 /TAXON_ID= ORGANISM="Unidentified sp., Strain CCMP1999" /NCGR_SAMPLE_ID=MMETSP1475 /ASSEMBLY_ACC=CAM_ASM_001111 /LENGTH=463 /DNA_ID=CAMNT_0044489059 /DNA_START=124 /DNA_END=1515 /DNA_ORIENTATION=-